VFNMHGLMYVDLRLQE